MKIGENSIYIFLIFCKQAWLLTRILLPLPAFYPCHRPLSSPTEGNWRQGTRKLSIGLTIARIYDRSQLHQRDSGSNLGSRLNLIVYNNRCYRCRESNWDLSLSLSLSHVGATGPWRTIRHMAHLMQILAYE